MLRQDHEFGFGIESEYLLCDAKTFRPQWWEELEFSKLNAAFEAIQFEDLATPESMELLDLEAPHQKKMPYVIEGYHLVDSEFRFVDIRPKGVEIRTPVATSLDQVLSVHTELYRRMQKALLAIGHAPVALSHHPIATRFRGPQNKRRHDFWQWAMQAMTTYGPDINVSVPRDFAKTLDREDLEAKVNAYAPAMAAFSVASPFLDGKPWEYRGSIGKSVRTHQRSLVAPPIEIHPHEDGRYEFKVFEMTQSVTDYRAYFLLFLELLLDDSLKLRATAASRTYDLGSVARHGIAFEEVRGPASELLEKAPEVLKKWGFHSSALAEFQRRFDQKWVPADAMVEQWNSGKSLEEICRSRSEVILEASV